MSLWPSFFFFHEIGIPNFFIIKSNFYDELSITTIVMMCTTKKDLPFEIDPEVKSLKRETKNFRRYKWTRSTLSTFIDFVYLFLVQLQSLNKVLSFKIQKKISLSSRNPEFGRCWYNCHVVSLVSCKDLQMDTVHDWSRHSLQVSLLYNGSLTNPYRVYKTNTYFLTWFVKSR